MVSFGNLPNRVSQAHEYSVSGCKGTRKLGTYARSGRNFFWRTLYRALNSSKVRPVFCAINAKSRQAAFIAAAMVSFSRCITAASPAYVPSCPNIFLKPKLINGSRYLAFMLQGKLLSYRLSRNHSTVPQYYRVINY